MPCSLQLGRERKERKEPRESLNTPRSRARKAKARRELLNHNPTARDADPHALRRAVAEENDEA